MSEKNKKERPPKAKERVKFKDGYVVLDGYETEIREERWKKIEKGMEVYRKAFKIAEEMMAE